MKTEKPENSAHGDTEGMEYYGDVCGRCGHPCSVNKGLYCPKCEPHRAPKTAVVEPSESQEEIPAPIGDFILAQDDIAPMHTLAGAYYHYADVCTLLNRLKEKFTITRK